MYDMLMHPKLGFACQRTITYIERTATRRGVREIGLRLGVGHTAAPTVDELQQEGRGGMVI